MTPRRPIDLLEDGFHRLVIQRDGRPVRRRRVRPAETAGAKAPLRPSPVQR
jgi:hypothetical protein